MDANIAKRWADALAEDDHWDLAAAGYPTGDIERPLSFSVAQAAQKHVEDE